MNGFKQGSGTVGADSGSVPLGRTHRFLRWAAAGVGVAILAAAGAAIFGAVLSATKDAATAPVEVNVHVDPAYWKGKVPNWTPYFYYLPARRSELTPPLDDCRDRREWAWQLGGTDADETRIALTLTGNRATEVSLDSVAVEVTSRSPLAGGVVAACPVGGATAEIHGIAVDLAAETASFVEAGSDAPARFTLAPGETEAYEIYASLWDSPEIVEWHLVLSVVDGSERRSVVIDDGGEPFRTAGANRAGTPMVIWEDGAWASYDP